MHNKQTIRSGQHFSFHESPDAKTLAVVFSSRNTRPPKFTFWKTFQQLDCHTIYFNSPVPEWYRCGIPDISGGIRGAVKAIQDFAASVGATRIVTVGSSMGAYGAHLHGSMAGADHVLAFGFEPLLGVPGGKTEITINEYQWQYPDISGMRPKNLSVIYGEMDINDTLGAGLLYQRQKPHIISLPHAQHDTPDFLARDETFANMLSALVTGNPIGPDLSTDGPHLNNDLCKFLWRLNAPLVAKNWKAVDEIIKQNVTLAEQSRLAMYMWGVADYRLNQIDQSITKFQRIIETTPLFWEAWQSLSASLNRKSDFEAAIEAGLNAIRLRPHRSIAHLHLSHVYDRAGKADEALEHALWACRLNWSRDEYRTWLLNASDKAAKPVIEDKDIWIKCYDDNVKLAHSTFGAYDVMQKLPSKPWPLAQHAIHG
ncbi:tetratricopeptide repeat protein [Agrobacterium sp. OT33]|uniref:tetratricopeptide repeat protein n=1 Tax=Agrobacterium sp. OT33 TaxID=2815338 RepID=UPI001A8F68C9|nr:tetratricopeptide repeat protein [Agrobacterium sp. OT33]MBO0126598.1 hypothetical protein [Agrobacterium sp. OT33]